MPTYHIVTDSGARLSNHARSIRQYGVTVVPNKLEIGGRIYREDAETSSEDLLKLIASSSTFPKLMPPTVEEYIDVFSQLAKTSEGILSLHTSREMSASWRNAQLAVQHLAVRCPMIVVDSRTICAGQGMLVRLAGKLIAEGVTFQELVDKVRSAVDRVYSFYCAETMESLHHNGILSQSRAILATLLGIKPLIAIEDGQFIVSEKVKTRTQIVEQLAGFVTEFTHIDDVMILQPRSSLTETTRLIQDRLSVEFNGMTFPFMVYGASLGAFIGTDAMGVAVLESETVSLED